MATICHETDTELPALALPDQKVLLRVFFAVEGAKIVLLLAGYDKGKDPSTRRQEREIKQARKLLKAHQRRRRETRT